MKAFFSLLLLTILVLQAFAQHDSHCATSVGAQVSAQLLQRPLPLRTGLGKYHDPVTTSSKEAQAFYNQGIAYLHGYVWIEAARSFRQALRHDSTLAMGYTGLSFAYAGLEDYAGAKKIMERATALASKSSLREQARIKVRMAQLAAIDSVTNPKLHQAYKNALDGALAQFSDDAQLWLLRGNAEEPMARGRGQRGGAASIAFYEAALNRFPEHPAAHHYLTHSYENIASFDKALYYGKLYAQQAYMIPHAQHMYGHDLMKVGRMDEAITYFSKTDSLEQAYYASEDIEPWMDWHHGHNMTMLALCYQYQGQMQKAENLLKEVASLRPFVPDLAFYNRKHYPAFLMSTGRMDEAMAFVQRMTHASTAAERALGYSFAGRIHLQKGQETKAKEALQAAQAQMPEIQKAFPAMPGMVAFLMGPYINLLKAQLALREPKSYGEGLAQMKAFQQKARRATSPDGWIEALFQLEDIAQMALQTGDIAFAEESARLLYEHDPQYPGALFSRAIVAEKKKEKADAKKLYAQAAKGWAKADRTFLSRTTAEKRGSPDL